MEQPELEPLHHHHTGRSWLDLVLGISAVSISFISLFLAMHNGRAMERLVQANSWPFVQVFSSTSNPDGSPHMHIDIANKGVGPASIEYLQFQYAGQPVKDARALLNAMLGRVTASPHPRILTSDVVHSVLAAREQIVLADFSPAQDYSEADYAAIGIGLFKVRVLACYCSVFEECWSFDNSKPRPVKVQACPVAANSPPNAGT